VISSLNLAHKSKILFWRNIAFRNRF